MKLVNGRWCGKFGKYFEKKRRILNKAGFTLAENVRIVGPFFCTAKLIAGENVFIGAFFKGTGGGKITIGANVDIAPEVTLSTGGHKIGTTLHRAGEGENKDIKIGSGTWLCQRVLVVQGVSVANGNVIGAGAVVTHDTEPNSLYVGIPAIRKKEY